LSFKLTECVFGNRFSHIPEKIEIEIEVMNGVQPHGEDLFRKEDMTQISS
jgi:hypothetical protein